jgi:hypothetical protein
VSVIEDAISKLTAFFGKEEQGEAEPQDPVSYFETPLLELRRRYTAQYSVQRRETVRRVLKQRRFWEGEQNISWNEFYGTYVGVTPGGGIHTGEEAEVTDAYVVNRVRGYGMSFVALVRANRPTLKWLPESRATTEDIRAAEMADDFMRHYDRVNKIQDELEQEATLAWTDGVYGSYVRYVVDGDRFGWDKEPVMGEEKIRLGPDVLNCPCGVQTPMDGMAEGCQACGAPAAPEAIMSGETTRQVDTGQRRRIPRGRVVRDVVGSLELFLPGLARRQDEMPFIARSFEVDRCHVMQRWKKYADKAETDKEGGSGTDDTLERRARLALLGGATVHKHLRRSFVESADYVTVSTWWFRPWAFNAVDEKYREQLKTQFPYGCKVTFAGDMLTEIVGENMDDVWRLLRAVPGDGYATAAVSTDAIPLQEMFNDLVNLTRDNIEFSLPMVFADPQSVDLDRIAETRVKAGAMYKAKARPGGSVGQAIHQTQPASLPPYAPQLMANVGGEWMQHMTGVFPASFGGDTGGNLTAHGIAIERDQAMGRIGMHYAQIREHHIDWAPLAIAAYVRSGEPISFSPETGAERAIDPRLLEQGRYRVMGDVAAEYPMTWAQRRQALMTVIQSPAGQPVLTVLGNAAKVKAAVGVDIEWPGEASYKMQMEEIEELLRGQPQPVMGPDGMPIIDPMTGQPAMRSSVPVEPDVEDNAAHLQAGSDWWTTKDARRERQTNPGGVQNVLLHLQEHRNAMQQAMMAQAAAQPQQGGSGGGNEGGPGPSEPATLSDKLGTELPELA